MHSGCISLINSRVKNEFHNSNEILVFLMEELSLKMQTYTVLVQQCSWVHHLPPGDEL